MSRLPSFFTVSSGNAQLLQTVMVPIACNSSRNGQAYWNAQVGLLNVGTIQADTIIACNFSGGRADVIGDKTTGVAIAGDGSDIGTYTALTKSNIAGFGTRVLGGYGISNYPHGTISGVVAMGASALNGASNVYNSVFVGTSAGHDASGASNTVAVGDRAGYQGQGSNNVYLGTQSGFANRGSGNVFVGSLVGVSDTTTNNTLYVGNQSAVLLRGDFANGRLGVNLAPGITPTVTLDVSGNARITGSNLIGGVTLNSSNVFTTGTISGVFRNGVTSDNTIGGITISGSNMSYIQLAELRAGPSTRLGEYGYDSSGGYLTLNDGTYGFRQIEARTSSTGTYFNLYGPNDTGRYGSIRMDAVASTIKIANSTTHCNVVELNGNGQCNAGSLKLFGSNGDERVIVYASDPNESFAPYIEVKDNANVTSFNLKGDDGALSNKASSSSSVGGVTLGPNGYLSGGVPIGSVTMYASSGAIPTGWLFCDGDLLSTTTYAALFSVIQYTYGGSGGSFRLPNMQGRFPLGDGSSGGSTFSIGQTGGEERHTLTIPEMPRHKHSVTALPSRSFNTLDGGGQWTANAETPINTTEEGSNQPHNNMPPYLAIRFIIRAF